MRLGRWSLVLALASCTPREPVPSGVSDAAPSRPAGEIEVVPVVTRPLETVSRLEGELLPFEAVALHARASGFVSRVLVDRGSAVKTGQLLLTVVAPELAAQRAEAEAKLVGDKSRYERLHAAAVTPGAVAASEVEVAEATFHADESRVQSLRQMEQYLTITAPFDGVVTERNVHPGALVGPQAGAISAPMLRIEQVAKLRLTVPVPESLVGAISEGSNASFTVRAWPGQAFLGVTRRISRSVDTKTRSMAVELDVDNASNKLAPGMFAEVAWPVRRIAPTNFVPPSAIVQSTEKTFVVRIKGGLVDHVSVQRGSTAGDMVEVFGPLEAGDLIARRGSEELRAGSHVPFRVAPMPSGIYPAGGAPGDAGK